MSDDPSTATGLIVKEMADVLPAADKRIAGRDFGTALKNLGSLASDLTGLLASIVSIPRRTGQFFAWTLTRFRQIPDERRRTPSPKLLLEAAQGYAEADDDELRSDFERLVESAMDSQTASGVHPSFVISLRQMSGLDARFMRLFAKGCAFRSFAELAELVGAAVDLQSLEIAAANLERLGYIEAGRPTVVGPSSVAEIDLQAEPKGRIVRRYFEAVPSEPMTGVKNFPERVTFRISYRLTNLGEAFLSAVRRPE